MYGPVTIGDRVLFGPRVGLYGAGHPLDPEVRAGGLENGGPITIGDDVWLGGGVVVLPGVTIGAGAVIAAGAMVTRDIPSGVLAAGVPCPGSAALERAGPHLLARPPEGLAAGLSCPVYALKKPASRLKPGRWFFCFCRKDAPHRPIWIE